MASTLVIHDVPIECINQAAVAYHIPAALLLSVLGVEGGYAGTASPNRNGTFDYGPMQINTIWLSKIKPYGYTREDIQYNPCKNVMVGAWILSQNIADSTDLWRGIGGYHSYTTSLNEDYQHKVWKVYQLLASYLSNPSGNAAKTLAPIVASSPAAVTAAAPAPVPSQVPVNPQTLLLGTPPTQTKNQN